MRLVILFGLVLASPAISQSSESEQTYGNWYFFESSDPMTDERKASLLVVARAIETQVRPTPEVFVAFECRSVYAERRTIVHLGVQIAQDARSAPALEVRIDDEPVQTFRPVLRYDEAVLLRTSNGLLDRLSVSSRLRLRTSDAFGQAVFADFDLDQGMEARNRFAEACASLGYTVPPNAYAR